MDESTRLNLLLTVFNIMLLALVVFALLNTRTEIRYVTVVQTAEVMEATATAAEATATAAQATAYSRGIEVGATRAVEDFIGQLTATAWALPTITPGSTTTVPPSPLPTDTPTPRGVSTPIPSIYPTPELMGTDIMGCNVVFRWDWPRELTEDEYFEVRVGTGTPERNTAWIKEPRYELTLMETGKYTWEVALCRGNPRIHQCEQLAISERHVFSFSGCPTPVPSLIPPEP
jgi:hypothetical protein